MAGFHGNDAKGTTHESGNNENAAPSKAELVREKIKLLGHYAMLAFAPVVATLATAGLIIAVIAVTGNQSAQEQISKAASKIETLSNSLSASKAELEKLKVALAHEKAIQDEQMKKQDERMARIIQNITPMQVKMRISPTLEEQLRQPVSAAAAASAVVAPVVASSPHVAEKKLSPQGQMFKEAIEQYNKH